MKILLTSLLLLMIPATAGAFSWEIAQIMFGANPQTLGDVLYLFIIILSALIPILIGLAVLLFIFGLVRYLATDNENTKKQAIRIIGYGIVSIFVMVSIWGIIRLMVDVAGLNTLDPDPVKKIPTELPRLDTEILK